MSRAQVLLTFTGMRKNGNRLLTLRKFTAFLHSTLHKWGADLQFFY